MLRLFKILVFIYSCARVGYPPGKPELISPKLEITYPEKFKNFPIELKIKVSDNTKVDSLKIIVNNLKIYEQKFPDSIITITIDTLNNFSDTISVYNFQLVASDVYENKALKEFKILYKREENQPVIELLEKQGYTFKIRAFDDTKLKNLYIYKNDSLYKVMNLNSKDTIVQISVDSLNLKKIKINAIDIYNNESSTNWSY
ncbi:MAG: hypothetical protein N2504_06405 [candidate division WOR-3 bacterium]|nr:hypothetical protein [candidate division WOR-3 bacterium]